ncbi:hypothetical protein [Porticoccus sp.]
MSQRIWYGQRRNPQPAVFRRDLTGAAVYFLHNNRFYIDLKFDTGTMEFERLAGF